jgi:tetratricopeptide (TPR) repeat protein
MTRKFWIFSFLLMFSAGAPVWAQNIEEFYKAAEQYYSQKDYDRAFDAYQSTANVDPKPYRAYSGMGNCQYALGKKEKALEYYQKSLDLYPSNPQLSQFIQKLKLELASKGSLFYKGHTLFGEKKYKEAIPFFQQALLDDAKNMQAYYELGYSQFLIGSKPEAALNLAYYGKKESRTDFEDYANRLKATLTPDDREWMDDQLKNGPPFSSPFRYSGFGVRLETLYIGSGLKDLADYAASLKSYGETVSQTDSSFTLNATAPSSGFAVELNPFIQASENIEVGLTFGYMFMGQFNTNYQSDSGLASGVINPQVIDGGLSLRVHFMKQKKGKVGFFIEGNPAVYMANLHVANSDTSGTVSGWGFVPVTGEFSGTGFGGKLKLGVDWKPIPNSMISGFLGYQYAQVKEFKGDGTSDLLSDTTSGQLQMLHGPDGDFLMFVPDGPSLPLSPGASLSPLTLDFSGILVGLDLTVLL